MFYHDNGKLQIFANTRCGNTNLHHYFGIHTDKQKKFPPSFGNDLVIVLRNPLDRMVSAVKGFPKPIPITMLPVHLLNSLARKEFTREFVEEAGIFYIHCNPFLRKIENRPFRIIDFYQLNDYVPRRTDLMQSPTTNSSGYTDPKTVYVENKYFTLKDLEEEYEAYQRLINDREQISITEWKEKTT